MSESDGQLSADGVDDIVREHENEDEGASGNDDDRGSVASGSGAEDNNGVERQQNNPDPLSGMEDNDGPDDNAAAAAAPKVETKKRVVRNLAVLNTERLKGRKGVHTIEKLYQGFQFHGKGHEKQDLDGIMKRLEYWAYRLFPKLEFDDFLAKVESLSHKKDLQTHLKKYRLGDITADDNPCVTEDDMIIENEDATETEVPAADAARRERELLDEINDATFERLLAENMNGP